MIFIYLLSFATLLRPSSMASPTVTFGDVEVELAASTGTGGDAKGCRRRPSDEPYRLRVENAKSQLYSSSDGGLKMMSSIELFALFN
jgi:hypothetical protein